MTYNTCLGFLAAIILSAMIFAVAVTAPGVSANDDDDLPPPPPRGQLTYPNLGSHLSGLTDAYERGSASQSESAEQAAISQGESVAVTIYLAANVADVVQFLQDNGGDPRNVGEDYIEAYVPVSLLGALSVRPGVIRIREIIPPFSEQISQQVIGNGPAVHGSLPWNQAGYGGQGVKVGIIDTGFQGLSDLRGTELPADVVARCYTDLARFTSNLADCEIGKSSHGTIVAESLLDIAPAVSLYIANPVSNADMQATVDWMASQGVKVINHSVSHVFEGPGDGTSYLSVSPLNTVDRAVANGIVWVNAAGNHAARTWFGGYSNANGNRFLDFNALGDEINILNLSAGRSYDVQLRWEDTWGGASTDLDVRLYNTSTNEFITLPVRRHPITGQLGNQGADPQSGGSGHIPLEYLRFVSPVDGDHIGLVVEHFGGPAPGWVQLLVRGGGRLEFPTYAGSIVNPAESSNSGMLAVGATHWFDTQTIAFYSGSGPAPDGRTKPDVVGVDCGETALRPLEVSITLGGNCGFAGTSQASPHVAGLAALVKQANPTLGPQQIARYLKNNAAERQSSGPDNTWGYGLAQLPAAPAQPPPPIDPCGADIGSDGATTGAWTSDCESEVSGRGYARYYSFTLPEESTVTVSLESSVDTYLYLRSGESRSGAALHENDDHEGGGLTRTTDSRISETLSTGTYTVEATTYSPNEAGNFTLTITGLGTGGTTDPTPGPTDPCGADISGDGNTNGTWSTDCQSEESGRGYAKYYTITLDEGSEVTVSLESSVDTYLYLRSGETRSGAALHENDDHEGGGLARTTDSRISETLGAGTYTIEATTYSPNEAGSFTLTVSGLGTGGTTDPTPDPTDQCGADIGSDGATTGAWTSDCESEVSGRGYAKYYTFTLDEGSEVTISLESSVDTYLYLRSGESRSGAALHENDDHEGGGLSRTTDSRISETLGAGTYTIEATTYSPNEAGSFTLTVSGLGTGGTTDPTPDPTDQCGESLSADGTTTGTWSTDCESEVSGRGYAKYYTFTLDQGSAVTIDLESSVDTYLYLRSGESRSGAALHENDDHEGGGLSRTTDSRISETLGAGRYTIEATTYSPNEAGSFTLTVSGLGTGGTTDPTPDPTDQCGESVTADGATTGAWTSDCESEVSGRGYARYYSFTLPEESTVTVSLESSVDTYLYLRSGESRSGAALHENDDHEGGGLTRTTDSRISETLSTGTYTVEATTYSPNEAGNFTLTITGLGTGGTTDPTPGPTDPCGADISGDGNTNGTWSTDCQSEESGRGYAKYYTITLDEGSEVTVSLESSVDTYLYLRSGETRSGAALHENDDHEGGGLARTTDSRISETLGAGTYTIEATTYSPNEAGSFTLTVSGLGTGGTTDPTPDPTDQCGADIGSDGATTGAWTSDCESEVSGRGYAKYYTFTLDEGSEVTISLESSVDTYLYLRSGESRSGAALHENDDHEGGGLSRTTDSRISETLGAGTYTIEATTYSPNQAGSFTLTVSGLGTGSTQDANQLEILFEEIISKTQRREAFSLVKESTLGFSAIEEMEALRSEFVSSRDEADLYYALIKLSNARRDRHLRVSPVEGGLHVPEQQECVSAPIDVLPDVSDIDNPKFFVSAVFEALTLPEAGDLVVSVNGLSIDEYIDEFSYWIRHSTLRGLYWRMAGEMTKKVPNVPPSLYSERLVLSLQGSDGQIYDVSLPYSRNCYRLDLAAPDHDFENVMERENFKVLLDRSQRLILLDWRDFEYSLIQDVADLIEYAQEEQILDYDMVIDVTYSGGGSRGAYAIQRLVDQRFRTTFGNVRLSDLGIDLIEAFAGDEPDYGAPDIDGLNLSRSWLIDWARTDAMDAINRGDEYTPAVPFKLAHLPKDSDGFLSPAATHFSGNVAIINGRSWGGSHLDQFVAMFVDNNLAVFLGVPTGGYSNTWEGEEVLRYPDSGLPLVEFQWSIGHTIRPNGEVLEGYPAQPDQLIPVTQDNFQEYHQMLLDAAIAALKPTSQ